MSAMRQWTWERLHAMKEHRITMETCLLLILTYCKPLQQDEGFHDMQRWDCWRNVVAAGYGLRVAR
ncbi:hypothetical protein BDR03DRAFT_964466 [Suillus americanus]|nr:hypothetical protein BDR03DRAFT_964466 [Suillus americanus]